MLARLRQRRFFSLNELNRSLHMLLADLNQHPFKQLPGRHASAFAEIDQPALRPLSEQEYEYAERKVAGRVDSCSACSTSSASDGPTGAT